MILVETNVAVEVAGVRVKRDRDRIVLVHPDSCVGGAFEDWREIIRQVSALLEPEKVEAEVEETPDPRGYVFIDRNGRAWGWDCDSIRRSPRSLAKRPFLTRMEAEEAAKNCYHGFKCVEVWTPECGVPPMPEKQP